MQSFIDDLTRQIREQAGLAAVGIAVGHQAHPVVLSVSGVRRHDMVMHPAWSECTLEHLLTHTAGVPANFPWKTHRIDSRTEDGLIQVRHELIKETPSKLA